MKTFIKNTALFAVIFFQTTIHSQSSLNCINFMDNNNGVIAADNGTVQQTLNGGITWKDLITGVNNNLYCIHQIDANTGIAVGQNGLIIISTDGFQTWQVKNSGTARDRYGRDRATSLS